MTSIIELLHACIGFEWDSGNAEKNWLKHRVARGEIEQAFLNRPLMCEAGHQRNDLTPRFHALGHTDDSRLLFIVFTIRGGLIRVISARPMSRKEREVYLNAEES
ncbi:MAG: BrnT family toxin [Chloroflexota bacterium]